MKIESSITVSKLKRCPRCEITKPIEEFLLRNPSYCKPCLNERNKEYYLKNKEAYLQRKKASNKRYRQSEAGKISQYKAQVKKYQTNLEYKLAACMRARITTGLRAQKLKKNSKTTDLIGCSIKALKSHLESLFTEGMTWENYGKDGWEIDHIKPISKFNLTKENEQRICFHYTNLQPLWREDNLIKSNKYGEN